MIQIPKPAEMRWSPETELEMSPCHVKLHHPPNQRKNGYTRRKYFSLDIFNMFEGWHFLNTVFRKCIVKDVTADSPLCSRKAARSVTNVGKTGQ